MDSEIYVVVADNDKPYKAPGGGDLHPCYTGPLVFETYVNDASKETAEVFIARLGGRYGKCRIAKLNFIEINEEC